MDNQINNQQFMEMIKSIAEFGATLKSISASMTALATTQEKLSDRLDLSTKEANLINKELSAKIDQVENKVVKKEIQSQTALWIGRVLITAFGGVLILTGRSYLAEFATKDYVHDTRLELENKIDKVELQLSDLRLKK